MDGRTAHPARPGGRLHVIRCTSLRPGGRGCWRRVGTPGGRCLRCWTELAGSPSVTDRAELAAEADLPAWVAEVLAADLEAMVRVLIAERGDIDPALLERLSRDRDASVRAAVAANRTCPEPVERHLACHDPDRSVLIALAAKPSTSRVVRAWLSRHPSPEVAGRVRRSGGRT